MKAGLGADNVHTAHPEAGEPVCPALSVHFWAFPEKYLPVLDAGSKCCLCLYV